MDISVALLTYLHHLTSDPDDAAQLAAQLQHLGDDVAIRIPSWRSISIILAAEPHEIDVSILAPDVEPTALVLSSLAVRVSDLDGGAQLIVRAGQAGAFLLLGDDLSIRLGSDHPITIDQHLTLPLTNREQAAVLAERGIIDQALGALLEEGFAPAEAGQELQHRATAAALTLPAAAQHLLSRLDAPENRGDLDYG